MATTSTGRSWRKGRIVAASATALALTFGVGACGGGDGEKLTAAQVTAAVNSALAELRQGELDKAKESFEKVLDSDGANKFAHYNLGYIAQTQGDLGEAEQQYREAIKTDPKFVSALYNLAIVVTPNDTDEAIDLYRRAIKSNKNDANSHFNLGLLLRQQGKTAEGNSQIQQAVALNPALADQAAAQGVPPK
jgi:Tfp pilus assembly protein PilF